MVISLPNMRHILILKQRRVSMKYNNTKIVNAFAGPGAGKTTACLEIVSQLKMRGKSAEYVPEYAKELILKHSRDFGGTLTDKEVMLLAKVSRNTYYKYKSDLKK